MPERERPLGPAPKTTQQSTAPPPPNGSTAAADAPRPQGPLPPSMTGPAPAHQHRRHQRQHLTTRPRPRHTPVEAHRVARSQSINASKPSLCITVPASNNPASATKDPSSNTTSNPSIPPATLLTGSASPHGQNDRYNKQHSPTSGGLSGGRANPTSFTASVDSG